MLSNMIPKEIGIKLDSMMWNYKAIMNETLNDILHGVISGIPMCCIIAFITHRTADYWTEHYNEPKIPKYLQYYPCRYCLRHKRFAHGK